MANTTSVVEIVEMPLDDLLSKATDLFKAHHKEVSHYQDDFRLEIDTLRYKAMEQRDSLMVIGAKYHTKIVGYSVSVIAPMSHHASTL